MSDTRPAPQYGEYATPEQQRAAMGLPTGLVSAAPAAPAPVAEAAADAPRPRIVDRAVTVALMAYGLVTVLSTIPQLVGFSAFADMWMDAAGIDAAFTNHAQGAAWGTIAAVLFGVGWALTAFWSWRRLARRRLAWWVPLVGAVVTYTIVTLCLLPPLLSDPAVISHLMSAGR